MQKLYYSIREVSRIADEEQHILRYWEKEFGLLSPKKNRGGNRIYSEKDLSLILKIKKLLREEKLSIRGAKERIEEEYGSEGNNLFYLALNNKIEEKFNETVNSYKTMSDKVTFDKNEAEELIKLLSDLHKYLKKT
ncbi:MAG: hypothetical protein QG635_1565 [Bacteroidota bacterium]|nr:hypothetical protein [Bacteroidota bacterium]